MSGRGGSTRATWLGAVAIVLAAAPAHSQRIRPGNSAASELSPEVSPNRADQAGNEDSSPPRSDVGNAPGQAANHQQGRVGPIPKAGTPNDLDPVQAVPERRARQDSSYAILGRGWLVDGLILIIAALLGALAAGPLALRRARHDRLARISQQLHVVQKAIDGLPRGNASSGSPDRNPDAAVRRPGYAIGGEDDLRHFGGAKPSPTPPPPAARRPLDTEQDQRMGRALEDYRQLLAVKGAKASQLGQLLSQFRQLRALQLGGPKGIAASAYDRDDPNVMVVAAGDGHHFAVLPTYNYLASFSITFSAQVQNPAIMSKLFRFNADGSKHLRVDRAAQITIDDAGAVDIIQQGQLSGFVS